jgi:hypothetical protein
MVDTTMDNDPFAQLVIPDVLTPDQYYDRTHRDDHETRAVKRLMLAVLSDAVRCLRAYNDARNPTGRLRFAEAEAWILDQKAEGPWFILAAIIIPTPRRPWAVVARA